MNIVLLKSRRTGYSTSSHIKLFAWQMEYVKYLRRADRIKRIKSIFNI